MEQGSPHRHNAAYTILARSHDDGFTYAALPRPGGGLLRDATWPTDRQDRARGGARDVIQRGAAKHAKRVVPVVFVRLDDENVRAHFHGDAPQFVCRSA